MSVNPATAPNTEQKVSSQPAGLLLNNISLIVLVVLFILAAWAGQTAVVVVLGLALSAGGLTMLWSRFALKGVRVERRLTENRAFPGEYLELKLRVVNRKLLPLPWVQVSDEVPAGFIPDLPPGDSPGSSLITESSSIMWYSAISWRYRLYCRRRGYYRLGPLTVSSGDIFGFYPRTAVEPSRDYILVYPRIYPITPLEIPSLYPVGEAKSARRIFEDPSRPVGLRDYAPGDSLRRIHWKASARHQRLQVKVFDPSTALRATLFLAIDSFQQDGAWNYEIMESGISTAASLSNYLVDIKSQVGFWSNARLADSGQPACIPSGSGSGQLTAVLEALAKTIPVYDRTFVDFFQAERKNLASGATLVFVFSRLSEAMKETLADLRESGYRIVAFQIGEVGRADVNPDIPWYQVLQPDEIKEAGCGEN